MNKKAKEPFFLARIINMILGFLILFLILLVIYRDSETKILETVLFALAAVGNFIAATIAFSEKKRLRGNIYALACAVFFIAAAVMFIRFTGIL